MVWCFRLVFVVVELIATTWKRAPCLDQSGDIMGVAKPGEITHSSQSSEKQ